MRAACQLSRRWHQQFCRSPNFTGHQQCLHNLAPRRGYRQLTKPPVAKNVISATVDMRSQHQEESLPRSSRNDVVVHEFEVDDNDKSKLNPITPNKEILDEMEATKAELMQLERELSIMKQGPFGPQSELMRTLSKDERGALLDALSEEGVLPGQQEDLLTMAELESLAKEDVEEAKSPSVRQNRVSLRVPRKDQGYVRHFNKAIQATEEKDCLDIQQNLNLWRWYLRCQQQVPSFSNILSEDVWQTVWESQVQLQARPKHLVVLANDILEAGRSLDPSQSLLYIKSLHACEESAVALQVWEACRHNLHEKPELEPAFWEVGVKICADLNQPSKSQELAFIALKGKKVGPEILAPVIAAWARNDEPHALLKSWACYIKLREYAGPLMSVQLLEKISNAFLDTHQGEMALAVFKDMLVMGESSLHDSREVYQQATKHIESTISTTATEEQINKVGLSALLSLPRRFQNRFFFTSWIKRLIGEKRVDSASMVVELMYERGIAPDAKPLNGIIGAWLREGTPSAQAKAESMAWSMIEARGNLVAQRRVTSTSEGISYRSVVIDDRATSERRQIPCATIETFSILLQHYTRRQKTEQAERLTNTMIETCQIQPNSYIMNHWLLADLRAGRLDVLWTKFCNLKRDIRPDLETMATLWDAGKVQYSKYNAVHARSFPSARSLFAEMKDWYTSSTPKKMTMIREDFSAELYEQIIRCYSLSADLPGTLIAVQELARLLDFYPTDNALRLICGQAARLLPSEDQQAVGGRRPRRSALRNKSVMVQVAEVIEAIEAKQRIALLDQGSDTEAFEDPDSSAAQQLRLSVVIEFICMFMRKTQAPLGSYLNDVKNAAQSMHVNMDDLDLDVSKTE